MPIGRRGTARKTSEPGFKLEEGRFSSSLAGGGAWTEAEETACRSFCRGSPWTWGEWGGDQNTEEPTCVDTHSAMLSWNPRELNFPALWKRVKTNGWAPLIPDSASPHISFLGCFSVSLFPSVSPFLSVLQNVTLTLVRVQHMSQKLGVKSEIDEKTYQYRYLPVQPCPQVPEG